MRIIIVTHYFPPEIGAPQVRLSALARVWAAGRGRGHSPDGHAELSHRDRATGVPRRDPAP